MTVAFRGNVSELAKDANCGAATVTFYGKVTSISGGKYGLNKCYTITRIS